MRSAFVFLSLAIALTVTGSSRHSRAADPAAKVEAAPTLRLLVPAYFYPAADGSKDWTRLFTASAQVPIVAIVNPASGPGKTADSNYVEILTRSKKFAKITLIGYVHTSYGKRSLADVKADVDQWVKLYPGIKGIFFDEQASGADHVAYQVALYKYVRAKRGLTLVISNPGTVCVEKYLSEPATDAACLFEGPTPFDPSTFPKWVAKYSPGHVAALSYKVGTAKAMQACIRVAVEKKVGYCFVTDAEGANPWGRLPTYWDDEVAQVRKANLGAKP